MTSSWMAGRPLSGQYRSSRGATSLAKSNCPSIRISRWPGSMKSRIRQVVTWNRVGSLRYRSNDLNISVLPHSPSTLHCGPALQIHHLQAGFFNKPSTTLFQASRQGLGIVLPTVSMAENGDGLGVDPAPRGGLRPGRPGTDRLTRPERNCKTSA